MSASGNFAELAQQASSDAVLIVSPTGTILHWDQGAEVMFGYPTAEAVGRSLFDLMVPPGLLEEERQLLEAALRDGAVTFESLRRRKDGSRLYACISSRRINNPKTGETLVLSTKKDVTQLRVRRDTQRVEAQFRDLLESVPDGIVIVNPSGHVVYVNANAQRLFGHRAGELLGRTVESLLPPRFHEAHLGHRVGYFEQPRTRAMGAGLELFGLRNDGSEFPVEISLSPLIVDDTTMAMSAIRDVSARKRIERELREKNVELEAANRAKDQFLASMSHELRTPLNSIIGFTGILLMKLPGPLNADQEKQLLTVQSSARHLLSLINDLLDLAKIGADKVELERELVDCGAMMRDIADALRPQAEQKQLQFHVQLPREPVTLHTDRRTLSQIVINLTANAVKFTDHGSVTLQLARIQADGHSRVEIHVCDTGPGIRAEDRARMFEPFARLGGQDQRAKAGSGLGLHLSQKMAGRLGGAITCASEPGRGSRFTLALPE
jgi:PAS domain S-box-containing protein